ncbi:hypothetical protein [Pseudoduganella sp. RAF53_2]|uniref:hypothetical protein n=1 Tax=unclassified Pseudoduganella TaxID=2637179 RepID=UPI003F9C0EA4
MRKFLLALLLCLMLPCLAWARGISFSEEMHGYAWYGGEYRLAHVYLNVRIGDIDAWRSNPNHSATVSGTLVMDGVPNQPVTGTLNILSPAPGDDGRLLAYRLNSAAVQVLGVKHVHDDPGMDLIDDMTTLHAVFAPAGQALPSVQDVLYQAVWTSELHFEWWKPDVVWDFTTSMSTINTAWYDELTVRILFVETIFSTLAKVFFPWV